VISNKLLIACIGPEYPNENGKKKCAQRDFFSASIILSGSFSTINSDRERKERKMKGGGGGGGGGESACFAQNQFIGRFK
jgi:hypothetical protein